MLLYYITNAFYSYFILYYVSYYVFITDDDTFSICYTPRGVLITWKEKINIYCLLKEKSGNPGIINCSKSLSVVSVI